jgi:hypothetical protein
VLAFIPALVACATTTTSDVGQVRESRCLLCRVWRDRGD